MNGGKYLNVARRDGSRLAALSFSTADIWAGRFRTRLGRVESRWDVNHPEISSATPIITRSWLCRFLDWESPDKFAPRCSPRNLAVSLLCAGLFRIASIFMIQYLAMRYFWEHLQQILIWRDIKYCSLTFKS